MHTSETKYRGKKNWIDLRNRGYFRSVCKTALGDGLLLMLVFISHDHVKAAANHMQAQKTIV
jgi:hypothetical protein